jgi:hypothetical protein
VAAWFSPLQERKNQMVAIFILLDSIRHLNLFTIQMGKKMFNHGLQETIYWPSIGFCFCA